MYFLNKESRKQPVVSLMKITQWKRVIYFINVFWNIICRIEVTRAMQSQQKYTVWKYQRLATFLSNIIFPFFIIPVFKLITMSRIRMKGNTLLMPWKRTLCEGWCLKQFTITVSTKSTIMYPITNTYHRTSPVDTGKNNFTLPSFQAIPIIFYSFSYAPSFTVRLSKSMSQRLIISQSQRIDFLYYFEPYQICQVFLCNSILFAKIVINSSFILFINQKNNSVPLDLFNLFILLIFLQTLTSDQAMASKQPFKLFNITQKLTTWSIRINKFLKHRLLSKRKHVLLISDQNPSNFNALKKSVYLIDKSTNQLVRADNVISTQSRDSQLSFEKVLLKNLHKTWEISQMKSINVPYQKAKLKLPDENAKPQSQSKEIKKKEQQDPQEEPSTIVFQKFTQKAAVQALQNHWVQKRKYFDSIIVLPQSQDRSSYPQISDEAFATSFIETLEQKIMKNVVAYRYASKFLNTSGTFIQSVSEYDFLKKTEQEKRKQEQKRLQQKKQPQEVFSYAKSRPPASKQMIDNTICYLGIVVGDRDHTDLNSWTLVSLGEQASWTNPTYVGKMYYDWADGQQLPMPGSFALFKKKSFQNKKQLDFIQYL